MSFFTSASKDKGIPATGAPGTPPQLLRMEEHMGAGTNACDVEEQAEAGAWADRGKGRRLKCSLKRLVSAFEGQEWRAGARFSASEIASKPQGRRLQGWL